MKTKRKVKVKPNLKLTLKLRKDSTTNKKIIAFDNKKEKIMKQSQKSKKEEIKIFLEESQENKKMEEDVEEEDTNEPQSFNFFQNKRSN